MPRHPNHDPSDYLSELSAAVEGARRRYETEPDDDIFDALNAISPDMQKLTTKLLNAVDENPLVDDGCPHAEHRLGAFELLGIR